jgi:hypothetical protein
MTVPMLLKVVLTNKKRLETPVAVSLRDRRIRNRAPTESCLRNRLNRARCNAQRARGYPLSVVY